MTRTQQYPESGTRTYERNADVWQREVFVPLPFGKFQGEYLTLRKLALSMTGMPLTPTFSGFLSSFIRSAPYLDYSPIQATLISTVHKELAASVEIHLKPPIDFRPLLSHDYDRSAPVFEGLLGCPEVASFTYTAFQKAARILSGRTLYPKISKKTVGRETSEAIFEYCKYVPPSQLYEIDHSVQLLERIYHSTGYLVRGAVELRSAWKYNELKPRVYFAQGGDIYPQTKYVQAIFNVILEQFPCVHPVNRFNPPEDVLQANELLIVYDYSSFTSHMERIKEFVGALADFFTGVSTTLVDTFEGLVERDLGDILHSYNKSANMYASFEIDQLLSLDEETFCQHTCGMLGVPGNISSCTLLHGIFTMYLVLSVSKTRCVGDDAKLQWTIDSVREAIEKISILGDLSSDKVEFWEAESWNFESQWHYIKRPINRLGTSRVISGDLLIFPTCDTILGLKDDYHRYIPSKESLSARRNRFSSQWMRLLRKLWVHETGITDLDRIVLHYYQRASIHLLGLEGPMGFRMLDGSRIFFPLKLHADEFGMDPYKIALEQIGLEEEVELAEYDPILKRPYGYEGESFVSGLSPMASLLESLGYLKKDTIYRKFSRSSVGDDFFRLLLSGFYQNVYTFTVLRDIPYWCTPLLPDNTV